MRPASTVLYLALLLSPPAFAATETARYQVRFDATWSEETHPIEFPPNAHFSSLVGGVHDSEASFWKAGELASDGIKDMAERGRTSPLDTEVMAAITAGHAREVILGGAVSPSPGSATATFTADQAFPLVTLVTMIAPSPDWFVGIGGLPLFENGDWVEQKKVTLYGWDAGTDDGVTFTSANAVSNPRQLIEPLTSQSFSNGIPLGTFTFTRLDSPPAQQLALGGGRFKVELEWEDYTGTRARGVPVALTADSGYFYFFNHDNVEMVIKVLDGCALNGHYWVFAGGLTDVAVDLVVRDTVNNVVRPYHNRLGDPFQLIRDSSAFLCNP